MSTEKLAFYAIANARSLDELEAELNNFEFSDLCHDLMEDGFDPWEAINLDLTSDLPTFGGETPSDTTGIWSWDEKRILISENHQDQYGRTCGWSIISREDHPITRKAGVK